MFKPRLILLDKDSNKLIQDMQSLGNIDQATGAGCQASSLLAMLIISAMGKFCKRHGIRNLLAGFGTRCQIQEIYQQNSPGMFEKGELRRSTINESEAEMTKCSQKEYCCVATNPVRKGPDFCFRIDHQIKLIIGLIFPMIKLIVGLIF